MKHYLDFKIMSNSLECDLKLMKLFIFFWLGGEYAGCDALKKRLLPWLSSSFVASSGRLSADTSLSIIAESTEKERQLESLQTEYEQQLDDMESDLNKSKSLADNLSAE